MMQIDNCDDPRLDRLHYFKGVRTMLRRAGHTVFHGNVAWAGAVDRRAEDLRRNLLSVLAATGVLFFMLIRSGLGKLKGSVIAYILIISLMVSRAFSTFFSPNFNQKQGLMIFFGALLFYLSDMILASNRFWRPWKYNRISLAFYYSGQLLLALAAGYF